MMIMSKRGANHKLLPDEETLPVAAAEMKVMSLKPHTVKRLVSYIDNVVAGLEIEQSGESHSKKTHHKSDMAFATRVVNRLNKREPWYDVLSKKTQTGCIKVGALSKKG